MCKLIIGDDLFKLIICGDMCKLTIGGDMNDAKFLLLSSAFSEYGVNTASSLCFMLEFFTFTKFKSRQRGLNHALFSLCCVRHNQYSPSPLASSFVVRTEKHNSATLCHWSGR